MLYGTKLRDERPLASLIPGLAGSCPRIVAAMHVHRGLKPGEMLLRIRTMAGKIVAVICKPTETIEYIKYKVEKKEGISPDQQRLTYSGRVLEDERSLLDYKISGESTLLLSLRLRGGGGPRIFADASDDSILSELTLTSKAPEWRVCHPGLNLEGKCENRKCATFGAMVIHPKHFKPFNLMRDGTFKCPKCQTSNVTPTTCGFYDCKWKFDGIRSRDGFSVSSPWREVGGDKYYRFGEDESVGTVEWDDLLIVTKLRASAGADTLQRYAGGMACKNVCSICQFELGSAARTPIKTTRCRHRSHRVCVKKWAAQCKRSSITTRCPECRTAM